MSQDAGLAEFGEHRHLLTAVAYRIVGTMADAEDSVQDAWLRWQTVDHASVDDPRRLLVTITTRAAIDRLRRRVALRESYVGPWLPEPVPSTSGLTALTGLTIPDASVEVVRADSVSMAILVVLETLSPLERAVFVLHEAFGFEYPEIARILGRSAPAVRQLGHRARAHVRSRRPRFVTEPGVHKRVTERFMAAAVTGDFDELMRVLAPDVTLYADTGGKAPAPRQPVAGASRVARLFAVTAHRIPTGTSIRLADLNCGPAAVALLHGVPYAVFDLEVDPGAGLVTTIRAIANPDKLSAVPVVPPAGQRSGL